MHFPAFGCQLCACALRPLNSCAHPFAGAGETDDERWPRLATSGLHAASTWSCDRKRILKTKLAFIPSSLCQPTRVTTLYGDWQNLNFPTTFASSVPLHILLFLCKAKAHLFFFFFSNYDPLTPKQGNCRSVNIASKARRPLSKPPFGHYNCLSEHLSHPAWKKKKKAHFAER